jgi:hypothetical protein
MKNSTLKNAIIFLETDIENLRDTFVAAVESAVSGPTDEIDNGIDAILEDSKEVPGTDLLLVSREALEALRGSPDDVSDDLKDAVENLNWLLRKAIAEFKQAFTRETA